MTSAHITPAAGKASRFHPLSGDMTIDKIEQAMSEVAPLMNQPESELVIDFEAVSAVDSSTLAMMFAWLRLAKETKCDVKFAHCPPSLQALADLYEVTPYLPMVQAQ